MSKMHKTLKNTIHGFRQAASFARVLVYLVAAIVPVIAGKCWETIPEIQDKVACSCTGIFQCTSNGNGILRYNVCNDTGGIRPGRTKKDYKPTEAGYEWVCAAAMRPGVMLCVLPCAGCPACFLAGPLSLPCFKVCAGACGTTLFACGFTDMACSITVCNAGTTKKVYLPSCVLDGDRCGGH